MTESRLSLVASGIITAEAAILDAERACRDAQAEVACLRATLDSAPREERARAIACVDAEPEFTDAMPDEMWEAIRADRGVCVEAFRLAVVVTKRGIRERIEAAAHLEPRT